MPNVYYRFRTRYKPEKRIGSGTRFVDEFDYNSCWAQEGHCTHSHSITYTECMGGGDNFDRIRTNLSLPCLASDNISDISQCHNLM